MSAPTILISTGVALGASALLALAAPFFRLLRLAHAGARTDPAWRTARRAATCSALVIMVVVGPQLGWSFSFSALNLAAWIAALSAALIVGRFAFSLKPKAAWTVAGLLGLLAWLLALLVLFFDLCSGDSWSGWRDLGGGLHCHQTAESFLASGSVDMGIYRRYAFIDHQLYFGDPTKIDRDHPSPLAPAIQDALLRCQPTLRYESAMHSDVAIPTDHAYTPAVAPQSARGGTR